MYSESFPIRYDIDTPQLRPVYLLILLLNSPRASSVHRIFFPLKVNPRNELLSVVTTRLFFSLTVSFSFRSRNLVTDSSTLSPEQFRFDTFPSVAHVFQKSIDSYAVDARSSFVAPDLFPRFPHVFAGKYLFEQIFFRRCFSVIAPYASSAIRHLGWT